jgi:hypothetical protein
LIGDRKIALNKIEKTPAEAAFYIFSWDMMTTLQHTLRNTLNRIENTCDAQVMQLSSGHFLPRHERINRDANDERLTRTASHG